MNPERSVDPLSSVASLLRVKPQLQQLCRFGAQWASSTPPRKAGGRHFTWSRSVAAFSGGTTAGFQGDGLRAASLRHSLL